MLSRESLPITGDRAARAPNPSPRVACQSDESARQPKKIGHESNADNIEDIEDSCGCWPVRMSCPPP